jgi:hypothetical protein
MVQQETEETQEQERKIKREYIRLLQADIHDFMDNNDMHVLKRILFKTFVHQAVPDTFQKDKTHALMMMMIADGNIQTTIEL